MQYSKPHNGRAEPWLGIAVGSLAAAAIGLIFVVAPTEQTMGDSQRIVYIHVAVAWMGLAGFVTAAVAGAGYLVRRQLGWDHTAQAAAEVGWLCSTLTLITGSIWAYQAWGVWWTWDPRLTTTLILWTIYAGYFVVRGAIDDPAQRARIGAVLSIIGALDVPLVIMATRWFRGMHPVSPQMEPTMRWVLLASVAAFTLLFVHLIIRRRSMLNLAQLAESLADKVDGQSLSRAT